MDFEKAHKLSIVPAIILCLLSALSILLTSLYWVITDWVTGRWVVVPSEYPEKDRWPNDDVVIDYTQASTNATITAGCLNLACSVVAIIAWQRLRNHELDTNFNAPLRRFYVIAVYITGTFSSVASLTALILHFTDKGDDKWGCTSTTGRTSNTPAKGIPFTNLLCSREIGACNFLTPQLAGKSLQLMASSACNTAVTAKWLQLIMVLFSIAVMVMFFFQAKLRRKVRWSLHSNAPDAKSPF
ncbi:hypothetical protein P280DRAFT_473532 [Massarina eburnea CBS 473.64]|uniref:Uncharacterized protein n=1 Tax=Massarina eburnea CBS 473.64 TaxID=1395130 RepID=A0A6A6RKL6_9PLEO|nr:hypothetical protein P280DRAFT_473532 [Massarina eburnea CBS 473.64]